MPSAHIQVVCGLRVQIMSGSPIVIRNTTCEFYKFIEQVLITTGGVRVRPGGLVSFGLRVSSYCGDARSLASGVRRLYFQSARDEVEWLSKTVRVFQTNNNHHLLVLSIS